MPIDPENLPAADDEAWLDRIFDVIVDRLEDGEVLSAEDLAQERPHLRSRVETLLGIARRMGMTEFSDAPEVTGYEIVREAGRGSTGVVYLARQIAVEGRAVALKILHAGNFVVPEARERFVAEARALARVSHPHVLGIHDVIRGRGFIALATEWIDGPSLADVIARAGEAPTAPPVQLESGVADALITRARRDPVAFHCRTAQAIAGALHAVHRAGLLHRDVKPSNILLRPDGTPLLGDFGLVREEERSVGTKSGVFVGTAAYASPEQLRGENRTLDVRADVFSLGATLYHGLVGKPPFGTGSMAEILRRSGREDAPRLRRLNPRLPVDLETIVATALDRDPALRYPTAAAMGEDLERLLGLRPILARRTSPVRRILLQARRHPLRALLWVLIGLGSSALAVAALVAVPAVLRVRAEDRELRAELDLAAAFLEIEEGNPDTAAATFDRMLAEAPASVEALAGLVMVHTRAGRVDRALELVNGQQAGADRDPILTRLRAYVLRASNRDAAAQEAVGAVPRPETALAAWVESLVVRRSLNATADERWHRARDLLLQAVLLSPRPRLIYIGDLCVATAKCRDEAAARAAIASLLRHWPDEPLAHYRAGIVWRWLKEPALALASARRAVAGLPRYAPAHNSLGNALDAAGKTPEAVEAFEEALRIDPGHAEAVHNLGMARLRLGDPTAAVGLLERAAALRPSEARIRQNLGFALLALDRDDEAALAFEAAIGIRGRTFELVFNLALARNRQRRYEEAEALHAEACALAPGHAFARICLGDVAARRGRFLVAREAYEHAARVAEADADRRAEAEGRLATTNALIDAGRILSRAPVLPDDRSRTVELASLLLEAGWTGHASRLTTRLLELPNVISADDPELCVLAAAAALRWLAGDARQPIEDSPPDRDGLRHRALGFLLSAIGDVGRAGEEGPRIPPGVGKRLRALKSLPASTVFSDSKSREVLPGEEAALWEAVWRGIDRAASAAE